jgi:hypothetical protein
MGADVVQILNGPERAGARALGAPPSDGGRHTPPFCLVPWDGVDRQSAHSIVSPFDQDFLGDEGRGGGSTIFDGGFCCCLCVCVCVCVSPLCLWGAPIGSGPAATVASAAAAPLLRQHLARPLCIIGGSHRRHPPEHGDRTRRAKVVHKGAPLPFFFLL